MNDFFWDDCNDRELDSFHSDLLSIHEIINRSCPSTTEPTMQPTTATHQSSDTDRTNNELDSIEGDPSRRLVFLDDFSSEGPAIEEQETDLKDLSVSDSEPEAEEEKEFEHDEYIDSMDQDYENDQENDDDDEEYEEKPRRKRTRASGKARRSERQKKLKYSLSLAKPMPSDDVEVVEQELENLIQSPTDPVGKFLRKINLSAREAIKYEIHGLLLQCPRKLREKYGPRREIDENERIHTNRERNREHARATRQRRRIFKQVQELLSKSGYN